MKSTHMLNIIRATHTVIYVIMASSVIYILTAGLLGFFNNFVILALILVGIEGIIFLGNGMKCPLTALAKKHGAKKGYAFDTFLPEKSTKYTFSFFTTLLIIGILLLLVRL